VLIRSKKVVMAPALFWLSEMRRASRLCSVWEPVVGQRKVWAVEKRGFWSWFTCEGHQVSKLSPPEGGDTYQIPVIPLELTASAGELVRVQRVVNLFDLVQRRQLGVDARLVEHVGKAKVVLEPLVTVGPRKPDASVVSRSEVVEIREAELVRRLDVSLSVRCLVRGGNLDHVLVDGLLLPG